MVFDKITVPEREREREGERASIPHSIIFIGIYHPELLPLHTCQLEMSKEKLILRLLNRQESFGHITKRRENKGIYVIGVDTTNTETANYM